VAGEVDGENGGWRIKLIVFVGGTCGSVHAQTFNNNLKELGVVESKRNTIRKGLVHELLNAQDTVLCSYFAQRSGERVEGRSRKSTVEEAFQGLDRFEQDLERNSGAENGQDDYARKAQASQLTLVCSSRKGSLGSGNPRHQRSGAVGETRYGPSCRIDLQGFRVW
jgi:hypothetical protein